MAEMLWNVTAEATGGCMSLLLFMLYSTSFASKVVETYIRGAVAVRAAEIFKSKFTFENEFEKVDFCCIETCSEETFAVL